MGVLNGVDKAVAAKGSLAAGKALGDAAADLVYTPVTPCRLFDTRVSQGGLGTPTVGVRRTYGATTPVASQGNVAGCAAPAGAAVALIQIGTLTPSGNGLLQGGPQGAASFPNALILYQAGDQYGTAVAMPLNPANGQFDLLEQYATADLYGDLLGAFTAPQATALDCVTRVNPSGSLTTGDVPAGQSAIFGSGCQSGYQVTGGGCSYFTTSQQAPAATDNKVILNASYRGFDGASQTWLNSWTCHWTNNDTVTWRVQTRAMCCRVPGR